MAKDGSPESVGERAMFAPDAAPFALPIAAPGQAPSPAGARESVAPVPGEDSGVLEIDPQFARQPARWVRGGLSQPFLPSRRAIVSKIADAIAGVPSRSVAIRAFNFAVATELDRGIAFLLAPV